MTDLKGYLYYGSTRYDVTLSPKLHKRWRNFIAAARKEMTKRAGNGVPLPDPNIIDLEISGDGWRITDVGGEG
jgi:hypothetical protein